MSEKLYDALEESLKALETGADPESVAKRFPEIKDELLPLLETSRQARMLAIPEVPERVLRRSKTRILRHAAGMRESVAKSHKRRSLFTFQRLAVSLAVALLFFFSGTELVRASGGALPGDNLYPVKRTWEDVRLLLVVNPESREELESEFERERLHEVDELLAEGRHETITFAGVVTEQNGDLWVVSGVPVQITADSRLPETPVTVGRSVMLGGKTNARGYVEVDFIKLLGSNVLLPTSVPTQIETQENDSNSSNSAIEQNDNGHEEEADPESSSGEDRNGSGSEDNNHEDNDNSNSDQNENDSGEDHGSEGSGTKNQSDDDKRGNSGSERGREGSNEEDRAPRDQGD